MHRLLLFLWLACGPAPGPHPLPGAPPMERALIESLREASAALPDSARRTQHLDPHGEPLFINRLAFETSPYLQQHAHQPVDWYPWGPEALQAAASTGRPIFLSIGYSTCHWCHVMARESFDDLEVAERINRNFIPIKVDREDRPDVDATYLQALIALRGRGGWPANLVLSPEGQPLFAATYLPPRDGERGVERGLISVLDTLAELWEGDAERLTAEAAALAGELAQRATPPPSADLPAPELLGQTAERLLEHHDATHGGFGPPPRFPRATTLTFLLRHHFRTGDPDALAAVDRTLRAMARGALYDQLGGGFHRYTTDARWQVPHFEKMLYDQARLARVYLEAYQATGEAEHARIARETLDFMIREMSLPGGGFRAALDAESEGPEGRQAGRFYTWIPEEAAAVVDDEAALAAFGLQGPPQIDGRHALIYAEIEGISEGQRATARRQLLHARSLRPPPPTDDKVITAWHALAISALVHGFQVLGEPMWLERAQRGGEFALRHLQARRGRLHRSWHGEPGPQAVIEDLALLTTAMLDLFEASANPRWLEAAVGLQHQQDDLFGAENGAWYRTARDGDPLLLRQLPTPGGEEPSGLAASLHNLHRLRTLFGDEPWDARLQGGLRGLSGIMVARPTQAAGLLTAWSRTLSPPREILIIGEEGPERQALVQAARELWLPHRMLLVLTPEQAQRWSSELPLLREKHTFPEATAFVCERGLCEAPTSEVATLRAQLQAPIHRP